MMKDDEPVFNKSRWGTSCYVYNPKNPIGLAMIIVSSLAVIVMVLLMEYRTDLHAARPGGARGSSRSTEPPGVTSLPDVWIGEREAAR
ncbi:hypothetical protein [Streptomyces sp. NPDC126503]|uniref:hypothetical protein n=1 Tax=Streptomyces sp. NPDC126503 TaxID=3155315 RepID=UPI00331F9CC5